MRWRQGVAVAALAALLLTGCRGGRDPRPPAIRYDRDVCAECGMIISDERFAAAYVTKSGEARLFDDLGDMLVYEKKDDQEPIAYYVHDVRSRKWIPAEAAYYVRGESVKSPMGWNIAAFENEAEAREFAEKTGSRLMTWQELRAADLTMPHAHR
ncbi:nitrous oxide reductase accessory protein NosL [Caldinitratiruptor microaerophilus]|uniref:Copper chaperone NosL n=1 Tax=Caldinitratiruptor microaerophilus TaxID=671077 RepID=A0AA35CMT5_9FIRM|nr:nitrous oxide reductase accessory protein NosL [Caldinitratiruptor microaerophilus]BDG62204.1 hypothetical protein caldi_32940 [Caldinitratiruptor microaerophilus]